ncbi:MAG: type IV pilus twitching motility protein PilT [Acidobacteriota bacterium]
MDIIELLQFGVEEGASDIHISTGQPPIVRIHGDLKRLDHPPLEEEDIHRMIYDIMTDNQRKDFEELHELDFSYQLGSICRFRVNAYLQLRGKAAVFRTIPAKILTLEELGLPPILRRLTEQEKGLVLVTGPTGVGKSTTLAAMTEHINNNREAHIITVEDPIEFVHQPKKCLLSQRELGRHTHSFANALRSTLREDPDVILVGEMRDLETIQLALTAAETGHLVFATLHSPSAHQTVDRIIDVFSPAQQGQVRTQLAESLEAVITQTLCKKIGGGRVVALEILVGTPAVRNLIREGKIHQLPSTMQTGKKDGMQTMDAALIELVTRRKITKEEALLKSTNPDLFPLATLPRPVAR